MNPKCKKKKKKEKTRKTPGQQGHYGNLHPLLDIGRLVDCFHINCRSNDTISVPTGRREIAKSNVKS